MLLVLILLVGLRSLPQCWRQRRRSVKQKRKKLEKKMALEAKNAELSGQTNKTDIKENK